MVWTGKNQLNPILRVICIAMLAVPVACGSSPKNTDHEPADFGDIARADKATAQRAADYAQDMIGKPYRYGGNSPAGFDCSGLVQYSYSRAGLPIARTTRSQREAGISIGSQSLRAGDLIFFDQEGQKSSHVGIYIGDGRFVHAPSSGKQVRVDTLDTKYWKKHYSGARRI
jgi:cell wall-associated NlpC family hydrolase